MVLLQGLPWGLVASLLATAASVAATPSVSVGMRAAFPSPPYLIELLETAAQENETAYFPLLDRIADGHFAKASTDKSLYDTFVSLLQDGGYIQGEALSTFKLALSMRSAAPKIEAHYQFYRTAIDTAAEGSAKDCKTWVAVNGKQYCSSGLESPTDISVAIANDRQLPFDNKLGHGPEHVLYADITSPEFGKFHKTLAGKARRGKIAYKLRHRPSSTLVQEPLPVSGYGVELALKRTDYIVIDDRDADVTPPQKDASAQVVLDGEEEVADLKALSKSELAELGLKAADFIVRSEKPFETLFKLTQDFPKFSTSIAAHNTSEEFLDEQRANIAQMLRPGMNLLWMNGVQLIERQIQSFTLVDIIRRERKLINGVLELGLTGKEAVDLLGHQSVASSKSEDEPQRFDWRDQVEEGRVIIWLNDLTKDSRYQDYPTSLMSLLQPTMPGQVPPVRKDIFNAIFPVDFSKEEDVTFITEQILMFVKRRLPIRFGLVPLTNSAEATKQAKTVYYLLETYGLSAMTSYLQASLEERKTSKVNHKIFDRVIKERSLRAEATPLPLDDVLQSEDHEAQIQLAKHWAARLGCNTPIPPVYVDGIPYPRDESWLQAMSMRIGSDLRVVQEGIYYGMINEDTWIPGRFLEKAAIRRNAYIFPEDPKALAMLDVKQMYSDHADLFNQLPVIEASEDSVMADWAALTVVANLDDPSGLSLLTAAVKFRRQNPGIRLDVLYNPDATKRGARINKELFEEAARLMGTEKDEDLEKIAVKITSEASLDYDAPLDRFLEAIATERGANKLILNGRMIGPFTKEDPFTELDFQTFLEFERASRIIPVYLALEDLGLKSKVSSPLAAAKLTSITAMSTMSDLPEGIFESAPTLRISAFNEWNATHTSLEVGDIATANIHFTALINPASEQGQRWVPILKVLSELDGVYLKIFLNPMERLGELPVKRFYRYVLDSAPQFDQSGKVKAVGAEFKGLPSEALLNLGMDVPPAWLVAPKESVHDLDNIKLSSIKADVDATYELEHILIEGHSREPGGKPPRGVQLLLGTASDPHFADTIVMANLGYFQFKANPGMYDIQLKEGRSSDIFTIESVGSKGYEAVPGDEGTEVGLIDFQGTTLYPRLIRKAGMEAEDVLEEVVAKEGGAMGIVSKGMKFAEGILGGSKTPSGAKSTSDEEHAEINIFSVASGHLYERMLNIMMVSVMRHTNHTVKFWFIEQFLSPSFKDFIPFMAEQYGFKYEMVTYKWPHWLRQQKEKQREIWGYKILFLDVLFPLSLDKVIFVDADQIVRTDMYELVQHDLDGAPYGFTPMCDSRTEMEGFRFWKQGYWKNYLRGLPYHISALYVVDLRRFREIAAGDRLRQTYHQLSADPGSLSNLDQDLPNHMQFQIPIHSLPQRWLWCETWCSDESLGEAKTIDLCNNPQTKEPKLDRARRQVPEWTAYDDEIAALDRRRKGLPPVAAATAGAEEKQKVVGGEGGAGEEKKDKEREKDELAPDNALVFISLSTPCHLSSSPPHSRLMPSKPKDDLSSTGGPASTAQVPPRKSRYPSPSGLPPAVVLPRKSRYSSPSGLPPAQVFARKSRYDFVSKGDTTPQTKDAMGDSSLSESPSRGAPNETPIPLPPQVKPGFRPSPSPAGQASAQSNGTPADTPSRPVLTMKRTGGFHKRPTGHPPPSRTTPASNNEKASAQTAESSSPPKTAEGAEPEVLRVVSDVVDTNGRAYTSTPPATAQQLLKRKADESPPDPHPSQRLRTSSALPTSDPANGTKETALAADRDSASQDSTVQDSMLAGLSSEDGDADLNADLDATHDDSLDDDGPDDAEDDDHLSLDETALDLVDMDESMADDVSFVSQSASTSGRNLRERPQVVNSMASNVNPKQRHPRLDSRVPDGLEKTLSGRAYTSWHDGTRLVATTGVLLPDNYKVKVVTNMPWICPIRSCRQLFYTMGSLSKHWQKTHYRCKLNDNSDGTFSITGHYEATSSTTRLSRTPAVVVSRMPLDPKEPPMVEPHYVKPTAVEPKPQDKTLPETPREGSHVLACTTPAGRHPMWQVRRTLKIASDNRPYHLWKNDDGQLISASGALIPANYTFSTYPGHPWVCPIRDCRRVFKKLLNLGVHFIRKHPGRIFNDNQDGTLSDIGSYKVPGGSGAKTLPPRVLTSKPLSPDEPPMAEEGPPSAGFVTSQTPIPPPPVPAHLKKTYSTSGGMTLEPDTDWQPPPLTAASWETWRYIAPYLQKHKGDIIPDTGHLRELLSQPRIRDIAMNADYIKYHDSIPKDISAMLINLTGEQASEPCSRCREGKGPFKGCFVLKTTSPVNQQRSILSCGNCLYHSNQTSCSLRQALSARVMELFPDPTAKTEHDYWSRHHCSMAMNWAKYNENKRLGLVKPDALPPSNTKKAAPLPKTRQEPPVHEDSDSSAFGARRSGRISAMGSTGSETEKQQPASKAVSSLRKSTSSLAAAGTSSRDAGPPGDIDPHIAELSAQATATLLARCANAPSAAGALASSSSSALVSTGRIAPTMTAETLEMEDWEMAPGRIRSVASGSIDNIAFSNPYLTTNQAVPVDDGIAFRVEVVRAGQSRRLGPEQGATRICSLAAGKLRVRVDGEAPAAQFSIGPHGMFKLKPGVGATVENRLYIDSVLHISSVSC
ncbi:uncharacterized protein E0L32_000958 [Thyridium curvatum]|uniref:C2H2-type domain-containing protein n=1 Tax=Thyridium curvatum TaxID=1093900 RepID=A0A507B6V7_9PEZI|nr:uncharacterized protein E0L32_000958 [Thyridium curvatum]TPX12781.1 hypothetical protein E0L32_000958 [Thyridium curvatum]